MGFETELRRVLAFVYTARDESAGLTEREFDHVLVGRFDGVPRADPAEIAAIRWMTRDDFVCNVTATTEIYTPWFADAYARLVAGALLP